MENYPTILATILSFVKSQIPNFEIIDKNTSLSMKVLRKLLFFSKSFPNYTTTIYPKVYYRGGIERMISHTSVNEQVHCIATILHEYVHMIDRKKMWWGFNLIYLFPQCLALGSLLALFYGPWWLLCLVFLMPIMSPGRAWLESRGYSVTIFVHMLLGCPVTKEFIIKQFVGSAYYFMFPFRRLMNKWFEQLINNLYNNKLTEIQLVIQKLLDDSSNT